MAPRTISVGIDGSEPASSACEWAARLAERTDASLLVLTIWQTPSTCAYPSAPTAVDAAKHARSVVRSTLDAVDARVNVESVTMRGSPGPSLVDGSRDTDLLVVGRVGDDLVKYRPEFGELLGGSAARYCTHHSSIPVAAITTGTAWVDAPEVIVGIDGSPASLEALRWATRQLPASATIHAIRAVALPGAEVGAPADYELLDPVLDESLAELRRLVANHVDDSFKEAGRTVHSHVVLGFAQDGLIDPGFDYDIIVVGAHGETSPPPGELGSVAHHTLGRAEVPIVVVPAPPSATSN